jgi:subtilisin family serine protease
MSSEDASDQDEVQLFSPRGSVIDLVYDQPKGTYRRIHFNQADGSPDPPGIGGYTGKGQRSAVIDSGVLRDHPDLHGTVIEEVDFTGEGTLDTYGHGTMVSIVLAHRAPDAEIVSLKTIGADGKGSVGNLLKAFRWVAARPDLRNINLSCGVFRPNCHGDCSVCRAAGRLSDNGKVILAAIGNTRGMQACPSKNHEKVIPVAEVDPISGQPGPGQAGPGTIYFPHPVITSSEDV